MLADSGMMAERRRHVDILFLGSPGVGKATFLQRLPSVQHPSVAEAAFTPESGLQGADNYDPPPAYPLVEPLVFNVSLFARQYTMTICPSTSQLFTDLFPAVPHFVIICFAINSRPSLQNAQNYWLPQFHLHYPTSSAPVMLLGLQRDTRTEEMDDEGRYVCVMPEEGLEVARRMRCDRYAECSARTGELMWEAVEDITRTAAKTTLDTDYASSMCLVS